MNGFDSSKVWIHSVGLPITGPPWDCLGCVTYDPTKDTMKKCEFTIIADSDPLYEVEAHGVYNVEELQSYASEWNDFFENLSKIPELGQNWVGNLTANFGHLIDYRILLQGLQNDFAYVPGWSAEDWKMYASLMVDLPFNTVFATLDFCVDYQRKSSTFSF
eukprot:UN23556